MNRFLFFFIITFLIHGCVINESSDTEKQINKSSDLNPGSVAINYYADKSVKSLEVPPDLTQPDTQNSFRISEYATDVNENTIDFSGSQSSKDKKTKILDTHTDIEVRKSGQRRWLLVKKNSDSVWDLSKAFFQEKGFVIKKINKKIGIMETDFLENYPEIPQRNLGIIRKYLQDALKARYSLPIIDKYRVRIEPVNNESTEVHLSLFSLQEKLTSSGNVESTIWEVYKKDVALETEMLYQLMLYIGGDQALAREKILEAKDEKTLKISLVDNFNGYAKIKIDSDVLKAWDNINWALDQLNIDVEDKDIKERSFYIRTVRTSDIGLFSKILGTDALERTFQLLIKEVDKNTSEVIFNDISGENEKETKEFSYEFLNKIIELYK